MTRRLFAALSALAMPLVLLGFGPQAHSHPPGSSQSRLNLESNFGKFPLAFEPNRGQEASPVKFLCRGGGYSLFVTGDEAVFLLKKPAPKFPIHPDKTFSRPKPQAPDILRLKLAQANPDALFEGAQALPGISNYFIGPDPAHWVTRVPQYSRVVLHGVYPGVDVAYYGNQGRLEYDFQVNPGADPRSIHMHIEGADSVQTDGQGNLQLTVKGRKVLFEAPQVYQEDGTGRRPVSGRYSAGGNNDVSFDVKDYDPSRKLVIDPVLDYGTYLGGTGGDRGTGIAVDGLGNTYITGLTSGSFPITPGAIQSVFGSKVYTEMNDVFVSKFDPTGSTLLYSTYLGGTQNDTGEAIAVDGNGDAYVTGQAGAGFPTTPGAYQTGFGGGFDAYFGDAFLSKLNADGTALLYSTFLGGPNSDAGTGIALDNSGNAYLTGWASSTNFPSTPSSFMPVYGSGDNADIFVAKVNPAGGGSSDLVYSTFLGQDGVDGGPLNIAVDGSGDAYVVGATNGSHFTTTAGAFEASFVNGGSGIPDNFLLKLNPSGSGLVFSTYVGPSGLYGGYGIAFDSGQDIYITATSQSVSYPTSPGAYSPTYLGGLNGVVAELNPTGSALLYSTFLEQAYSSTISWAAYPTGIEVDDCGNIHVTGATSYPSFPLTSGAWDNSFSASGFAGFFLVLNPAQTGSAQLVFSTFMGSSSSTFPYSMAKDPSGNLYVAGETGSGFPSTGGSYQAAYGGPSCCGDGDAFVAKIDVSSLCVSGTATPTPTNSPTSTSTLTPGSTATPSSTPTVSATATPTNSLTYTSTATPSSTPTLSPTAPPTDTATPTPSLTPSSTPTVTTTFTPTDSPTPKGFHPPTATPTPAPIGIGWPYPNPDWGEGPVNIPIQAAAGCSVECKVYTTAFRKIRDFTRPMTADAYHLTWDLDDNWQAPVANGLYYMEVEVTGPVQMSKLFKVLVAR